MRQARAGLILMAIQLLLVLSVAGKYLYERKVCPRIWTRATQFDPNSPLRGRYLALQLVMNGCALPRDASHYTEGYKDYYGKATPGYWMWDVSLDVKDGHLTPQLADHLRGPKDIQRVTLQEGKPCDRSLLSSQEEYFIPDTAKGPFSLKTGQELWVEVTIPPSGPPRPIQIALSSEGRFAPLRFE